MSTKNITKKDVEVVWKDKITDFFPIKYKHTLWGYTVYAAGGLRQGKNGKFCMLLTKSSPEEQQWVKGLDSSSHVTYEGGNKGLWCTQKSERTSLKQTSFI